MEPQILLALAVAVVSGGLLYWHIQQVKKRPATGHDKLMGAVWAAMLVLSLARVLYLVAAGGEKPPETTAPTAPK